MSATRKAMCWIPSPRFSRYLAIGPSGAVDSSSSTSLSPTGKKAVVTFCSATVSVPSKRSPSTSVQKFLPASMLLTATPR